MAKLTDKILSNSHQTQKSKILFDSHLCGIKKKQTKSISQSSGYLCVWMSINWKRWYSRGAKIFYPFLVAVIGMYIQIKMHVPSMITFPNWSPGSWRT